MQRSSIYVTDANKKMHKNVVIQYLFKYEEHKVLSLRPHGNAKKFMEYKRMMPSTLQLIEATANDKERTPKEALDDVYCSLGDVLEVS